MFIIRHYQILSDSKFWHYCDIRHYQTVNFGITVISNIIEHYQTLSDIIRQ
jgi:hypothetical protein